MHIHSGQNLEGCRLQDQIRKQIKTLPIQLVPKAEEGKAKQGFTKCNLHFLKKQQDQGIYNPYINFAQNQEYVTLPLNYFNSLMLVALQNKTTINQIQSTQLLNLQQQQKELNHNKPLQEEPPISITQSERALQQKQDQAITQSKKGQLSDQEYANFQILIDNQHKYIFKHPESKICIYEFLEKSEESIQQFNIWIRQQKISSAEGYKLFWPSQKRDMTEQDQMLEQYKDLSRILLFEYFTKHAFCDIMKSSLNQSEDLIHQVHKILKNIMIPKDYQNFTE